MPTPGPRTTYQYSDAFKATALRLNQLPGVSARDVAESLYIPPFMLSRWRRLAREGQIMTKGVDVDPAVASDSATSVSVAEWVSRSARPLASHLPGWAAGPVAMGTPANGSFKPTPLRGAAWFRRYTVAQVLLQMEP